MWLILTALMAAIFFTGSYFSNKWTDNTVGANYAHVKQAEAATNIMQYTNLALNLVDSRNYSNKYLNNSEILTMSSNVNFKLLGDYRASIVNYGRGSYLIVSWSKFNRNIDASSTISELAKNLSNKINFSGGGSNAMLTQSNSGCNSMEIINGFSDDYIKKKNLYQSLVRNMCTTSLPSGYSIGAFNLILQVK